MDPTVAAKVTGTGTELYELLMTPANIGIVVGIPLLIGFAKQVWPAGAQTKVGKRLIPALPLILAEVAMFIPGLAPEGWDVGPRILLGVFLGALSLKSHVLLRKVGLGSVADILEWRKNGHAVDGEKKPEGGA